MADVVTLERVGVRVYFVGNTFPVKDRIKGMGGHFDGDRKQWWVGAAKAADAEKLVAALAGGPPPAEDLDSARVYAKARYKGRSYYVIAFAADRTRARLASLDGKVVFWKDVVPAGGSGSDEAAVIEKTYQPRERFGGYGRDTVREYQTLGGLRRFVERQKDPAQARGRCTECDHYGPIGETCHECHEGTHV
jgi:hypothetical protein